MWCSQTLLRKGSDFSGIQKIEGKLYRTRVDKHDKAEKHQENQWSLIGIGSFYKKDRVT